MKNTEIERKWLVDGFPEMAFEREVLQTQGYLSFSPNAVRIRKTEWAGGTEYRLTIKGKGTLTRTEVELPLDAGQYEALQGLLAASKARKRLRTYTLPEGLVLECSLVDEGESCAFYYAEVEFPSEEVAKAFVPPGWFGREVTEERGFTMAEYCLAKQKAQEK